MQNYTIVGGDNLWKIARNQYGDKLKSNADIQKVVNEIAKVNELSNPNLIYAGNTLEIPSYESIFNVQKEEEQAVLVEEETIYSKYEDWMKEGAKNLKNEDFDMVNSNVSYKSQDFIQPWMDGVQQMAQANIDASDLDKDGAINYNEYINQELKGYNEAYPDDKLEFDSKTGEIKDNPMLNEYMKTGFNALDLDKSSKIEHAELSSFYAALDSMDSTDGSVDGKIQFDWVAATEVTDNSFQRRFQNAFNKIFGKK